jgi:hypothetical protein
MLIPSLLYVAKPASLVGRHEAFVFGALMQEAWTKRLRPVAPAFALIIGLILGSQTTGLATRRYGFDYLPMALRPGENEGMIPPIASARKGSSPFG